MSHLIDSGDDGPGDPLVERHEAAQRESDSYDRGFEKGGEALYAAVVGELNLVIDPDCETPACAIICAINHIIAKASDAGLADRDRLSMAISKIAEALDDDEMDNNAACYRARSAIRAAKLIADEAVPESSGLPHGESK